MCGYRTRLCPLLRDDDQMICYVCLTIWPRDRYNTVDVLYDDHIPSLTLESFDGFDDDGADLVTFD